MSNSHYISRLRQQALHCTDSMNVLFITGDQFRASCLSCAHHPLVQTPNLDRLAKAGVRFASHYTQSTPCGPSRSCLHTSTYIHSNSAFDNGSPLTPGLTNWAYELTKLGYGPKLIGYVDTVEYDLSNEQESNPSLEWSGGTLRGLTRLVETDVMGTKDWLRDRGLANDENGQGWNGYRGSNKWMRQQAASSPDTTPSAPLPKRAAYDQDCSDTKILTDRAIQFVEDETATTSPWALHLSLLKPHPPWVAVEPFVDQYSPAEVNAKISKIRGSVEEEKTLHPWLAAVHGVGASQTSRSNSTLSMPDQVLDVLKATYYALVSELDFHLGRLFDALEVTNQWDNTLVIVTADHGEQLGDHYLIGKLGFYDQSYHIPLIIRNPSLSADETRGTTIPASLITEAVDIAPTIVAAVRKSSSGATVSLPDQFQGKSLLPLLSGEFHTWLRTAAHWEVDWRWWTIEGGSPYPDLFAKLCNDYQILPDERWFLVHRTNKWKLVIFPKLKPLLFDLSDGGREDRNLANSPAHRDVLASLLLDALTWKMANSGSASNRKSSRYRIGYDNLVKTMDGSKL